MIINIEMHERETRSGTNEEYFRLRKKAFRDRMGWDVPVHGDKGRDALDDLPCAYAL